MLRMTGVCLVLLACSGSPPKPPAAPPKAVVEPAKPPPPKPDVAAVPPPAPVPPGTKSLFERMGGMPAITTAITELAARTTTDPRIKERFFNVDGEDLRHEVIDFLCAVTGGPCEYTGRDMTTSHARMELVDEELAAFVEDLTLALDKAKVGEREKAELLGSLVQLRAEVVAAADKLRPIDDTRLASVVKLTATIKDKAAADLLTFAVLAGKRGQRSYAEQLFTRAEMIVGEKAVAPVASVFRAGAPPRITTALKTMTDTAAQPKLVGSSEADEPDRRPAGAWLRGAIKIDGQAPSGLGVVMLWPERGGKKRVPKQRIMEQRGKAFAPHVMAVPVGSRVSFPNFDGIYHNVFSLSKPKSFDLGMYKSGETREIKVDKPGIVRLGCNIHANMSAYLIVVDAPHYVVVDSDGGYSFKSLAPGKYRVQAWHEQSSEPATTTVTLKAGANEGNLDLRGGGGGLGSDKFGGSRQ
jgi:truncated hemoglobin YjbI/plastocyanin